MSIFRVAAVIFVMLAPAASAAAQGRGRAPQSPRTPAPAEDKVERIFERYYEAQGSLRAMAGAQTRIMRGYFTHSLSSQPGSVEVYSKAPNKTIAVLSLPGGVQFLQGFDGNSAWLQTPFTGAFVFDQSSSMVLDRDAEFRRKRVREMFAWAKYRGVGEVDGRPVEIVEAARAGSPPITLYFDAKGGLLLRADMTMRLREETPSASVTVLLDRYATVDGITLPVDFRFIYPTYKMTYKIYEVKHNVAISDSLFVRPTPAKGN